MVLVIDIGNTNIVLGVYAGGELREHWRVSTDKDRTTDEYAVLFRDLMAFHSLRFTDISGAIISSVVPPLTPRLERLTRRYCHVRPLIVGPGMKTGLTIRYDNPREIGADRIVNAVAAQAKYGGPAIIVDFGTATTFCALGSRGEYLGGAIAPGLIIATEALFQRASKLPRIEVTQPEHVIGKNTVTGMQAGIYYGYCGQVDRLVTLMREELGGEARVIATGGLARLIAAHAETIEIIDDFLTLDGLFLLHEKNSAPSQPQAPDPGPEAPPVQS
ncbi:MAG: type III pantothenate kinase [Gracilibacteraceae bacterium]|jgi:type III pantothenate kinase|nr:type III pantothenate kinase [Gracilibacteraceae bacterium]